MYIFSIWHYNSEDVRETFSTLEEAKARIKSWPWNYDPDNCAYHLFDDENSREINLHQELGLCL